MKLTKKLIALLMTALLLTGCGKGADIPETAPASDAQSQTQETENTVSETATVQILATSDLHGKFMPWDYAVNEENTKGSMTQLATAIKELRNENTILVDAGDTIQDNSADIFLDDEIHPMILAMNELNYDVWVTGNHEYNYGMDVLKKIIQQSKAKVLAGNVLDADKKPIADGYTIIEKNGIKVGIIGMVTPHITRWDAANLKDCTVSDPVEETKKIIAEIKDNVDVLVAVEHLGVKNEYETANTGATDLANACPELNVIVAAHEHQLVEGENVNGVLIVENKPQAQTISNISISLEKVGDTWQVAECTSAPVEIKDYEPDTELTEKLTPAHEKAVKDASEVIGKLEGDSLAPANEINGIPQAQLQDTALIDLINDVQLHYTGAKVSASALFVPTANLNVGDIKKCDTALIYKYSNTLYTVEMTGAQLKKFMEWSAAYYNTYKPGDLTISFNPDVRAYNYDMFEGVNYEVNISKEAGERIENLTWSDGSPVKDDESFLVAVNNYRANSQLLAPGEIFEENDMPKLVEIDIKGELGGVRELIRDYIVNVKGGTIKPHVTNNWKITGNDWDKELHNKAVKLINDGTLELPTSEDGRTPNVKSITDKDLK